MKSIHPDDIKFVLGQISDGMIFEGLAKQLTSVIIGHEFIPIGGMHDGGIDGLEHTFTESGRASTIYQFSIEKNPKSKIVKTIRKLNETEVTIDRFFYISNREIKTSPKISEDIYEELGIIVIINDVNWLALQSSHELATISIIEKFKSEYLHEFEKPGKAFELFDIQGDPRIFVFLRQQLEGSKGKTRLDEILADSLILYALEDTDPDKQILRTREEIISRICNITDFEPKWLYPVIDKRLKTLSSKPIRKIRRYQKINQYCLPYDTRLAIQEKNIQDAYLYNQFKISTEEMLQVHLEILDVAQSYKLLEEIFHRLFKQQGLEFTQFLNSKEGQHSIEKSLMEIVADVAGTARLSPDKRENVKSGLIETFRKIVYRGTTEQLEFLRRLADTYLMLFMLQCDPQIIKYFTVMSSKLRIFVDNSILIPALSEYYLDPMYRRHWNLLASARDVGIKLVVNEPILKELIGHFKNLKNDYSQYYSYQEDIFEDEANIFYIDQIVLRAYFYAKMEGKVKDFDAFYAQFVPAGVPNIEDFTDWLNDVFGIEYQSTSDINLSIDPKELELLYIELKKYKPSDKQARTDAEQLLTIYALRKIDTAEGTTGIFGYNTWWLTTDTTTQQAWQTTLGQKETFRTSPYIRSDFLYNYIALAPSRQSVDSIYRRIFPTVLGVNISYHVPSELKNTIQTYIADHKEMVGKPALKIKLKHLANRIKSEPTLQSKKIKHYLDELRDDLAKSSEKSEG